MKHWDGRDRDHVTGLQLSRPDRARLATPVLAESPTRLRASFLQAPTPRRSQPQIHSLIGLVLALGLLIGLALLLSPADPVSSKLVN